jgi:hypothetical protein
VSGVRNLVEDNRTFVVYQLKGRDMTVTLTRRRHLEPVIELALGSEVRAFPLAEFTHFWLTMIEVGRAADEVYLQSLG